MKHNISWPDNNPCAVWVQYSAILVYSSLGRGLLLLGEDICYPWLFQTTELPKTDYIRVQITGLFKLSFFNGPRLICLVSIGQNTVYSTYTSTQSHHAAINYYAE